MISMMSQLIIIYNFHTSKPCVADLTHTFVKARACGVPYKVLICQILLVALLITSSVRRYTQGPVKVACIAMRD